MVRSELVIVDHGPAFTGWVGESADRIVCVATPRVEHSKTARAVFRELARSNGVDCEECANCLIGRDAEAQP